MISEYSLLGFPLTPKEIREIAFEYADENNLSEFSEDKEIGGYKWFYGFMKYHDGLRVKKWCHQFIPCSCPWVLPVHHRSMV